MREAGQKFGVCNKCVFFSKGKSPFFADTHHGIHLTTLISYFAADDTSKFSEVLFDKAENGSKNEILLTRASLTAPLSISFLMNHFIRSGQELVHPGCKRDDNSGNFNQTVL